MSGKKSIPSFFSCALTAVTSSEDDLRFLAALLDGTATLGGLAVDTDLRWALLRRRVSRGVRGADAVDAELSRDATDAGTNTDANTADADTACWVGE